MNTVVIIDAKEKYTHSIIINSPLLLHIILTILLFPPDEGAEPHHLGGAIGHHVMQLPQKPAHCGITRDSFMMSLRAFLELELTEQPPPSTPAVASPPAASTSASLSSSPVDCSIPAHNHGVRIAPHVAVLHQALCRCSRAFASSASAALGVTAAITAASVEEHHRPSHNRVVRGGQRAAVRRSPLMCFCCAR